MKIKTYNTKIPYIVIDDWYTKEELKDTWSELDFYTNCQEKDKILRADETIVARDDLTDKSLAESYRWYPNQFFTSEYKTMSSIHVNAKKFICQELHEEIKHLYPWYNMFTSTNVSSPMISYYEGGDYYKPHHDSFMYTVLIWVTKKPKIWTGGDLFLQPVENKEKKVLFKNNRAVIFPSMMTHAVSPIEWIKKPKDIGHGRYTVTYFLYHEPTHNISEDKERLNK